MENRICNLIGREREESLISIKQRDDFGLIEMLELQPMRSGSWTFNAIRNEVLWRCFGKFEFSIVFRRPFDWFLLIKIEIVSSVGQSCVVQLSFKVIKCHSRVLIDYWQRTCEVDSGIPENVVNERKTVCNLWSNQLIESILFQWF